MSDTSADANEKLETSGSPPAGATGKAAEYLEKLVAESFKRELDQEENVVRSLPFFATSMGALLAFIGFARGTLPDFSPTAWPLLVYGLLACLLISLMTLVFFLYQSVRQRTFAYPMQEREMIDYADSLTAYYRQIAESKPERVISRTPADDDTDPVEVIEQAVVDDLRKTMLDQIAVAARTSRANNTSRLKARARAFTVLMVALGFAMALIIAILTHDAIDGGPYGQNGSTGTRTAKPHRTGREDRKVSGEAHSAGDAGGRQGGVELR